MAHELATLCEACLEMKKEFYIICCINNIWYNFICNTKEEFLVMKKVNGNLKLVGGLLVGILIGGATVVGANQAIQAIQNTEIKVSLNGEVQTFKDETTGEIQYPITYHDRTYLPLRNIAKLTGLKVDYDNNTNTALLDSENIELSKFIKDQSTNLHSIETGWFEGGKLFFVRTGEGSPTTIAFDENGKEVGYLEGDFGASNVFLDEKENKYYYYAYNLVDGREPEPEEYEKIYIDYVDGKIELNKD